MRFSAVQEEDGFGVGLGQENLASDVDDRMMAATGEILPDSKDMVDDPSTSYNLPLLFANGYPTSLDKISLTELERFITFMIQCSSDPLSTGPISPPQWWPKEVQFSNPFVRPRKINDNWMGNLKKLVFRCYTYHRSEYLLRFCASLAQYPREKLYYVNNWDSTTSLYHKGTGKLLATFRNENMEYDKIFDSPRRSLLPQNHAISRSSSKANKTKDKKRQQEGESSLVVIQPRLEEIYLCDNCDAEFGDLEQMKDHEKVCSEPVQTISSRSSTPYEPIIQPELNQNQFLDYFKLSTIDGIPKPSARKELSILPSPTIICEPVRSTRRMRTAVNFTRCPTIPFSSPAGIIMAKKSKSMTENTQQERLDRLERHLTAPPLNKFSRPKWLDRLVEYNRWVVTYKPNREKSVQDDYVHKYTFGAFKRKPVLTLKAQLLYVACGTAYVRLERLSPEKLEDLMQNPWKYRPPIPRRPRPKIRPGPLSKMKQSQSSIIATKRRNTFHIDTTCPIEQKRKASLLRNRLQRPHNSSLQNTSNNHTATSSEKTIVFVDLCSSDDDDDIVPIQTDENRDPMSLTDGSARTSPLKNGTINQTNCRSRSLGYPTTSLTDWLRDGVINKDKDKCTNKYIGGVIDKAKTYSSVLKSSP